MQAVLQNVCYGCHIVVGDVRPALVRPRTHHADAEEEEQEEADNEADAEGQAPGSAGPLPAIEDVD